MTGPLKAQLHLGIETWMGSTINTFGTIFKIGDKGSVNIIVVHMGFDQFFDFIIKKKLIQRQFRDAKGPTTTLKKKTSAFRRLFFHHHRRHSGVPVEPRSSQKIDDKKVSSASERTD